MTPHERPKGGFAFSWRWTNLLFLIAAWLIIEWILFSALARQIGGFGAMLFHISKGGIGLLLLGLVVRKVGLGLPVALREGRMAHSAGELFGAVAGATLIALPGMIPMFFGLALFSPSARRWLSRRFLSRPEAETDPRSIDLEASQWRRES
jgi:UPF0716 family protein affecting phage T7 exclusion